MQNKTPDIKKYSKSLFAYFQIMRFVMFAIAALQAFFLFGVIKTVDFYPTVTQWAAVSFNASQTNGEAAIGYMTAILSLALMAAVIKPMLRIFLELSKSGDIRAAKTSVQLQAAAITLVISAFAPDLAKMSLAKFMTPDAAVAFTANIPLLVAAAIVFAVSRFFDYWQPAIEPVLTESSENKTEN